jgi:hypothetical protein
VFGALGLQRRLRLPVDVRGALDVWICGGLGGFVPGWGVFTWHAVYFQVDVLFFKRGKEGEVGDLGPSAAKSECSH